MNKFWFAIWKEAEKQLLMESEDNFRKNSFRSREKESVSNVSEPVQNKDINTTGQ